MRDLRSAGGAADADEAECLMSELAKRVRDVGADAVANLVLRLPALEPLFIAAGCMTGRRPWVRTIYRRGTETLVRKLAASPRRFRRLTIGRLTVICDITDFTTSIVHFRRELYEPATTRFVQAHLEPGGSFIDAGASRGYFTLQAAALVGPGGRVYAFEPNRQVVKDLRALVEMNDFADRVTVIPSALADDVRGAVPLFIHDGRSEFASLSPGAGLFPSRPCPQTLVAVTTFDAWAAASDLPPIDVVKIDVEGAEMRVLRGMTDTLTAAPPARIICETRWGSEAHALLEHAGYRASPLDWWTPGYGNVLFTHRSTAE